MLEDGVIEKSNSEWSSPLVIVKKPSGDLTICVDYRKLNEATGVACYPLPNMTATLDRLDIVEYPLSSQEYRYCLVMVDHFTKWFERYPLRNQKSETIAKKVFDCWIPRHGAPEQIHHDQGKTLTAEMIQEICSLKSGINGRHRFILSLMEHRSEVLEQ